MRQSGDSRAANSGAGQPSPSRGHAGRSRGEDQDLQIMRWETLVRDEIRATMDEAESAARRIVARAHEDAARIRQHAVDELESARQRIDDVLDEGVTVAGDLKALGHTCDRLGRDLSRQATTATDQMIRAFDPEAS